MTYFYHGILVVIYDQYLSFSIYCLSNEVFCFWALAKNRAFYRRSDNLILLVWKSNIFTWMFNFIIISLEESETETVSQWK